MKRFAFALLAAATALAIAPSALATPITGTIAIDGSNDTWTLTQIKFTTKAGNATVQGAPATSGTLAAVIGDAVTFNTNPLKFASAVGDEMFSTGDGVTFWITGLTVDVDTAGFLDLNGTGTISENGYTVTNATWSLSSTKTGGTTFGIDAAPLSSTPEPSSLILLGTGLFGLAFVAFRKSKSSGLVLHS
ncbi:MAG: PEP-CTERM sorting domain-containing protein [Terracidiphilus sp.]